MKWFEKAALAIFAAITGYILFNVAIIESGSALINLGLLNLFAGLITWGIFRSQVKAWPMWDKALIGVMGIVCIVFGLRFTHVSLQNPAVTIEFIYDLVVITSVAVWALVEKPLGLQKTKVHGFDIWLHIIMAFLVTIRIAYHWQPEWTLWSFLPGLIAVAGYHLFNIGIRLAQKVPERTRSTNVAMNIIGGLVLLAAAFVTGGEALQIGTPAILGTIAVVMIVYALGEAYKNLGPKGLSSLVPVATYDGLLILAPIAMLFIYNQPFDLFEIVITFGFLAVMAKRVIMHNLYLEKSAA